MFDADGNGVIDINEFTHFLEQRQHGSLRADSAIKGLSSKLRERRIRKKTVFGQQVLGCGLASSAVVWVCGCSMAAWHARLTVVVVPVPAPCP
jgi:hypothetical protein